MRALPLLLAAVLLAGCQASPTLDRLAGDAPVPEPVYLERRASVGPQHDALYAFDVGERARELNVTLRLDARVPGLMDAASPARLAVEVLAPSGAVLARGTVDAAKPVFSFLTPEVEERGDHAVRVAGQGVAESLQGQGYGASYVLTVEVLHG